MKKAEFSVHLENIAGAFFLLLTLLMPVKYGTIGCMPEAGSFYPDSIIDYLYVSWPASTFGVFSGISLLLCILFCRPQIRYSNLTASMLLFTAALPLAALWGKLIAPSSFYGEAMFTHIAGVAAYLGAAYILTAANPAWKNRILSFLGIGTLLLTISAFHQYFFGFKEMQEFARMQEEQGIVLSDAIRLKLIDGRVYGAMSSANLLSGFMLCAAPLLVSVAAMASRRFEPQKQSFILFTSVAACLGFGTLLMTKTRGAFLALGAAVVLWIFSNNKIKKLYKVVLLLAIAAVFIGGTLYIKYHGRGFGSMAERVSYLRTAAVMISEKPLTGFGWGEFFYRHMQLKDTNSNESAHDPHNIVASFAVHTGVFGGLLVLAAFLLPLWNLWKKRNSSDMLTNCCLWGGVAGFLHALQDINLQSPAVICVLMLILLVNQDNAQEEKNVSNLLRYSCLLYMFVLGTVSLVGNWNYTRGDAAMSMLEECCRPSVKEKLYLATPHNVEKSLNAVNVLRPKHPFANSLAAAFFSAAGNSSKAEKLYLTSLALDSRRPGVLMSLADIYEKKGNITDAEKLRDKARKLFPSNPEYKNKNE
jgi:O-antigen ligase